MYFVFLLYRLIFSLVPLIFEKKIGIQMIVLISITVIYMGIILSGRCFMNKFDLYLDIMCLSIFLIMQHHLILFIDGGILNGTPNDVNIQQIISF